MFENYKTFKTTFAGRELMVETGKVCGLANGSCWVHYGETVVMVNVTASAKPREGVDFFPLAVDYEEKLYAVGKIPGGYLKREGRPSEKAILNSRVVDRPMRPLFPKDMRNDVAIVMTVLAVDPETQPEIIAMIGASIAVSISDIPWNGPIGGVWLGLVDGEYVINPTVEQREKSEMLVTVAGTKQKVVMIEAGANEVEESVMLEGIKFALRCLGKARKAVHLPERREFGRTAGQYFVDIGLVAHVEYDLILWRIKGALQRYGKLHHAEIGGQVPAGLGYRPHQKLPYLRGKVIKLILGNAPEILYAFDAVNVTGFHYIP